MPCETFGNISQFYCKILPQSEYSGPRLVVYPRLLIQYISSDPTYLNADLFVRNLRTHKVVVTRDTLDMDVHRRFL
jgi:hypothetical protein